MSSRATPAELAADPSNRWFWRFPMRRLAAEEVRDAMLAVGGVLRYKAGGPSIYPPIPREVLAGQSVPGSGWKTSPPDEAARRSIYVHVKRSLLVPIMAVHDAADTDSSCPVRYTTTVPTQALGMLNGEFANEQAAHLADRLRREAPGDIAAQVRRAIRLTTARDPDKDEVRGDLEFVRTLMDRVAARRAYGLVAILPDDPQCQRLRLPRLTESPPWTPHPRLRPAGHATTSFCGRTRREFLWEIGGGFGSVALAGMLGDSFLGRQAVAADGVTPFVNPMAPRKPSLPAKAKSVIFLFMYGGPSHVDTFDYKPKLYPMDGKTIAVKTFGRGGKKDGGRVVGPKWAFRQYGECGKWVSDLFPNLGTCVDDIAFLHSMYAESPIHGSAMLHDELRPAPQRASLPGHVGHLRAGEREREPAGVRGHARPDRRPDQRRQELVERLHAGGLSGDGPPFRRHADPRPGLADRDRPGRPPAAPGPAPRRRTRPTSPPAPIIPSWPRGSPATSWPSRCSAPRRRPSTSPENRPRPWPSTGSTSPARPTSAASA